MTSARSSTPCSQGPMGEESRCRSQWRCPHGRATASLCTDSKRITFGRDVTDRDRLSDQLIVARDAVTLARFGQLEIDRLDADPKSECDFGALHAPGEQPGYLLLAPCQHDLGISRAPRGWRC